MSHRRILRPLAAMLGIGALLMPWNSSLASQRNFYIPDSAITIDGDVSEWSDPLISDGEENPDRDRYCWNEDESDWELSSDPDECTTYIFDELGQIDILKAWFGVNEKNMLLAFSTATPMFTIDDVQADELIEVYDGNRLSEIGVDHLPNDEPFSHDMVFAFDVDPDAAAESYDWYIVANIDYDLSVGAGEADQQQEDEDAEDNSNNTGDDSDLEEGDDSGNAENAQEDFIQIWQEEGTTPGFQEDEDELVSSIDDSLSDTNTEDPEAGEVSEFMEIRQNVEKFYEVTGIQAGDEVGFRLETKSTTGDKTKGVRVVFQDEVLKTIPGKTKKLAMKMEKNNAKLSWMKPTGTTKVTYYRVDIRPSKEDDRDLWTSYTKVKKTSLAVKKLKMKQKYEYRVAACNADGCGETTKWFSFQMKKK